MNYLLNCQYCEFYVCAKTFSSKFYLINKLGNYFLAKTLYFYQKLYYGFNTRRMAFTI